MKYSRFLTGLLVSTLGLLALAPAQAQPTEAPPPGIYLYRTQTGDTLRRVAYQFLSAPADKAAQAVVVEANNWQGKPQAKAGFAFAPQTPVRIPLAVMLQIPAVAKITQISGEVQLFAPGSDALAAAAQNNATIPEGARLVLGATGRAVVAFPDESRMELQAGSSVKFVALKRYAHTSIYLIDVQLEQGRVEAAVNPARNMAGRFNLQSRRTVTGVRGTVFRIADTANDAAGGAAVVEVLRGEVAFSANKKDVAVGKGFGSFLEPTGSPAAPVPLLPAPRWIGGSVALQPTTPLPLQLPPDSVGAYLSITGKRAGSLTQGFTADAAKPFALPEGLAMGDYTLLAHAIDRNGLQGYPLAIALTIQGKPLPPRGISVIGQTQLRWDAIPSALLYAIEVSTDAATPVITQRTPHQFMDISTLPKGQYRARVATLGLIPQSQLAASALQEKQGEFSEWVAFERP